MRRLVIIRFEKDAKGKIVGKPEKTWPAVKQYILDNGGEQAVKNAQASDRVWAIMDGVLCTGIGILRRVFDSTVHVEDEVSRNLLIRRMMTVLDEAGAASALVFVDGKAEEKWAKFLTAMGAGPANRWVVPITKSEE